MGRILKNHIKTRREFGIFYKKGIGVLLEITLGNIITSRIVCIQYYTIKRIRNITV